MRTNSLFRLLALLILTTTTFLPGLHQAATAASSGGGMVYFNRVADFNGAFTRPDVIIDGKKIGKIRSGECHRIRLPAGRHIITVRDQTSLFSRAGIELSAARVMIANGTNTFITVRPLQQPEEFNQALPSYDLLVSPTGRRC